MPREGAIIFRDLIGKLDALNVECDKCGRRGRYHLHRLIERYGIDAKLFDWSDEITADCPRKQARNLNDSAALGVRTCRRCCSESTAAGRVEMSLHSSPRGGLVILLDREARFVSTTARPGHDGS